MLSKHTNLTIAGLLGAIVLLAGIIRGAFQVQGEMMWPWLFHLIVGIAAVSMALILVLILIVSTQRVRQTVRRYEWHRPIYPKGGHPHQWLKEIAAETAQHPENYMLITRQLVMEKDLRTEITRPWVQFGLEICNTGVHGVTVGPGRGRMKLNNDEMPDEIEWQSGRSQFPKGPHKELVLFRQYVPPQTAAELYRQLCEETHLPRVRMSLFTVEIDLQAQTANAPVVQWRVNGSDLFFSP